VCFICGTLPTGTLTVCIPNLFPPKENHNVGLLRFDDDHDHICYRFAQVQIFGGKSNVFKSLQYCSSTVIYFILPRKPFYFEYWLTSYIRICCNSCYDFTVEPANDCDIYSVNICNFFYKCISSSLFQSVSLGSSQLGTLFTRTVPNG
jgi:hypothetical protein